MKSQLFKFSPPRMQTNFMTADLMCKIIIAETYIVRKDTCFTWMYEKMKNM